MELKVPYPVNALFPGVRQHAQHAQRFERLVSDEDCWKIATECAEIEPFDACIEEIDRRLNAFPKFGESQQ